jgi:hypothetical protein
MASLQIRDLPGPLHQMLQLRARQHHRSLNQQASYRANGLSNGTSNRWKSATFRVATVSWCTLAIAAIIASSGQAIHGEDVEGVLCQDPVRV